MSAESSPDRLQQSSAALEFAQRQLGPATERLLSTPAAQALFFARLRSGFDLEDAVLGVAHLHLAEDPRLADEFLTYFLEAAYRSGRRLISGDLRSYLETGDLVHSVAGELWRELRSLRFEGRAPFQALVYQRMKWRASDEARRFRAQGAPLSGERSEREDDSPTPDAVLSDRDEVERLALRLLRLPERDQRMLRLYLQGKGVDEIAPELELSVDAARKALQRALQRARELH
jgi:RNA polymerase sigma factor (sigma-70 family)